jgi:hypothetical protein
MFTAERIRELLALLNQELARRNVRGELYLARGAVMCLVFHARPATKDIDALLVPPAEMRAAALAVARAEDLPETWLNDAVKGYFSTGGRFDIFEEFSHLRVYVPNPDYLFAMKCLAMRLGEEFQDAQDAGVLIRVLNIRSLADAERILERYYPADRYPAKARYILEELIGQAPPS